MTAAVRAKVLELMEPLLEEAERTGKWLWCSYQDIWISPANLRAQQAVNCLLWGPVNWKLRDPKERVEEAKRRWMDAQREFERIRAEVDP